MYLNTIKGAPGSKHSSKRVGRGIGSGLGKTGGRGHKGRVRPGFEGGQQPLQMRLPKFGFNSAKSRVTAEVTLSELAKVQADVIDLDALKDAGILKESMQFAKVMMSGEISKAVTVKGIKVTKGARAAIEAAGGKIEE